jgi:hypothetical protein
VSQPLAEPVHLPPASEQQVRSHAAELVALAARHGITGLAFASPGRLRGHVADDRDLFDIFEFQRAAADLLGAEVTVYSDGALRNQHVSPDRGPFGLILFCRTDRGSSGPGSGQRHPGVSPPGWPPGPAAGCSSHPAY